MTKTLSEKLVRTTPRESGGTTAANRFDFQKNWALCKLLDLHSSGDDYAIMLDYHEDIVVLDSEDEPTFADFYQIKSKKSGNWTIASLIKKQRSGKSPSILEKLFSNVKLFESSAKSIAFISSQNLSAKLADNSKALEKELVRFSELTEADQEKIQKALKLEIGSKDLNILEIAKTDLTVGGHDTYTKGKIIEFLEELSPSIKVSPTLVHKTLFDEIRRKTNSEKVCKTFFELKSQKCIAKSEFTTILKTIVESGTASWTDIQPLLINEGFNLSETLAVKNAWIEYRVSILEPWDNLMTASRDSIQTMIATIKSGDGNYTIRSVINSIKQEVTFDENLEYFSIPYSVEAAIIYELTNS